MDEQMRQRDSRQRPADTADVSDPGGPSPTAIHRRRFLEAAGFSLSMAAMAGCGRAPVQRALPLVEQPEGIVPGRSLTYASTCAGCPAGCGLAVKVRDGRPVQVEGLPDHPLSRGGLCAAGQAQPLALYDSYRLRGPVRQGKSSTWQQVDEAITHALSELAEVGGTVRFVTPTTTSPTLAAAIDRFLDRFHDGRHVTSDAVSCSAILDAHRQTHGRRALPRYQLDAAEVLVSFGADFLGTWISPVSFTRQWSTRRVPTVVHPEMSYHVHFEGRVSLTGSNADRRYRIIPSEYGLVLGRLACELSERAGVPAPPGEPGPSPLPDDEIRKVADRLWKARGRSLVLCDSQRLEDQLLVNLLNHLLGNYGKTLDIERAGRQRQGDDAAISQLVEELRAGQVDALFIAGTDLTHHLPDRPALLEAVRRIPLVVSLNDRIDDVASECDFVCPDHHPLESWMDYEPIEGVVSLSQPTIAPLHDTRSILESLARWSGSHPVPSAYEQLKAFWQEHYWPQTASQPFGRFWDLAVHDGHVELPPAPPSTAGFDGSSVQLAGERSTVGEYEIVLHGNVGQPDTRHAQNPWLQELPDPVTKATWDNYVSLSPTTARQLGVDDGDVLRVEATEDDTFVELPVLIQPGQHDQVLAMALGYGVRGTERFTGIGPEWLEARPTVAEGERVGRNVAHLVRFHGGRLLYDRPARIPSKTGRRHPVAVTQPYPFMAVPARVAPPGAETRHPVEHTTLSHFLEDPAAGSSHGLHHIEGSLWPEDHAQEGHSWGMAIDLNKCTGCSACLIACQSENNVPVVGKDEVRRQREMHWIRIDRYYTGEDDDLQVVHQPMMCQHCDNAPCETVCPVLATVHSDEGLNEQVYNRCVGTRYCANNCPYKVRRFNWFNYSGEPRWEDLALNPDVTVRSRGVMEKCSMCVQRIEAARVAARRQGEVLTDDAVQTACQQSCPAEAIVFGDGNQEEGRLRESLDDPRGYRVLEEFNFRPSVSYLRVVRNEVTEDGEDTVHG